MHDHRQALQVYLYCMSGDLITYAVCLCYKYGSPDPIISQDCDESLLHMLSG